MQVPSSIKRTRVWILMSFAAYILIAYWRNARKYDNKVIHIREDIFMRSWKMIIVYGGF